jgi:hypothetical protein
VSQQLLDWAKQALEMLEDNHHLVADNEKHAYVMLHHEVIKNGKALLEQSMPVPLTDEQKFQIASAAATKFDWVEDYSEAIGFVIGCCEAAHNITAATPEKGNTP